MGMLGSMAKHYSGIGEGNLKKVGIQVSTPKKTAAEEEKSRKDADLAKKREQDAFFKKSTEDQRRLKQGLASTQGRSGATVGTAKINQAPQEEMRSLQTTLANQLLAQTRGEGPSLAQDQLNRATDQNIAQSMAMAASQRGQSTGLGLRNVAQQTQGLQANAARDAATMRMAEQLQAQQALGDVSTQARGQDIGLATSQADMDMKSYLANQQAAMEQKRLDDAMAQFYQGQLTNVSQSDRQRLVDQQLMANQAYQAARDRQASKEQSNKQVAGGIISGLAQAAASKG